MSEIDSTGDQIIPMDHFDDWKCIVLPSDEEEESLSQAAANRTAPALTVVQISISVNEEWSDSLTDTNSQSF